MEPGYHEILWDETRFSILTQTITLRNGIHRVLIVSARTLEEKMTLKMASSRSTAEKLGYAFLSAGKKWSIGFMIACIFTQRFLLILSPFFIRSAIHSLQDHQSIVLITFLFMRYGLVRCMASVLGDGKDLFFAHFEQRAIEKMAQYAFSHIQGLPLRFHLDRHIGGLMHILEKGLLGIENFLRFFIFGLVPLTLELVLGCIFLWIFYPPFFGTTLALILGAYILFTFKVSQKRLKIVHLINKFDYAARSKSLDSLLQAGAMKFFGCEAQETHRYARLLRHQHTLTIKMRQSLALLNMGQALILNGGMTLLLAVSAWFVHKGQLMVADCVLINALVLQFVLPLHALGFSFREAKQAWIAMRRMMGVFDLPLENCDEGDAHDLKEGPGKIVFDNVSFGYTPDHLVLKNCSFVIPAHARVAFVGPTGAGKSTLFSLLSRLFDPQEGAIFIDHQNLRTIKRTSLRKALGFVPQETIVFNESFMYNLSYGAGPVSLEEVCRVTKQVKLHDRVMQSAQNYHDRVGERGLKLSGGERQRVGIARCLLRKANIFLFDEATASLDSLTEKSIQNDIFDLTAGHTTLIIAHRLSTIMQVDRIFVVDEGHIVEQGTHLELLAKKGLYARMWQRQINEG